MNKLGEYHQLYFTRYHILFTQPCQKLLIPLFWLNRPTTFCISSAFLLELLEMFIEGFSYNVLLTVQPTDQQKFTTISFVGHYGTVRIYFMIIWLLDQLFYLLGELTFSASWFSRQGQEDPTFGPLKRYVKQLFTM